MATLVYTDALVTINGIDLSDHCRSVQLNYEAEILDDTAMGTSGTRSNRPGLKNWTLTVEFYQDFAAANVDATLFALIGAVAFPIIIRPVKATPVGATNPNFTGNAVLESYPPITGEIGVIGMASATFRCAGVLTRAIA